MQARAKKVKWEALEEMHKLFISNMKFSLIQIWCFKESWCVLMKVMTIHIVTILESSFYRQPFAFIPDVVGIFFL